jgi:dihydroorotase
MFDMAVLSRSEKLELTRGGVMQKGFESMCLGLRGMPAAAEEVMVYREVALAELTGRAFTSCTSRRRAASS